MISVLLQFVIELLGTLFIAWLIFDLANIFGIDILTIIRDKFYLRGHHAADVKQQVESVIRLKEEIKSLLSNCQQNDGEALQNLETLQLVKIEQINMGERLIEICDQVVRELTAFPYRQPQELSTEEVQPSTEEVQSTCKSLEILEAKIGHLKEVIGVGEAANKKMHDENSKTIESIRDSLVVELSTLKNKHTEITISLERRLQGLYNHQADFEIGSVSKHEHELQVLRYQQEDDLPDVHPIVFLWKISGFQNKLQSLMQPDSVNIVSLEYFNVNANGLQVKPILRINSVREDVVVNLEVIDDSHMMPNADVDTSPFLHYRKYVLLDQSDDSVKENIELVDRPYFRMNTTTDAMREHFNCLLLCSLHLLVVDGKYHKNDQVLIKVVLEPLELVGRHLASNNGILYWKIDNYSKRKLEEIDGSKPRLISHPFRTSQTGYNVQVELFLNGSAGVEGDYMSIFVQFLLGEHDNVLPSPFRGKVAFFLMDQSDSVPKIHLSEMNECCQFSDTVLDSGFSEFVNQASVAQPRYLKNDSILIKTVIEIL